MSVVPTTQVGSKVIRSVAKPVKISPKIQRVIDDLTDSMRSAELVGMAAPQIGLGVRVFVTEIRKTKFRKDLKDVDPLRVYINPRIVKKGKKIVSGLEGCGSVAHGGLFAAVPRAHEVTVSAYDQNGFPFTLTAKGLLARVIQHEMDHLDGTVFLDRVKDMKTALSSDEFVKLKK